MKMVQILFFYIIIIGIGCENHPPLHVISSTNQVKIAATIPQKDSIPSLLKKIIAAYPLQKLKANKTYLIWPDSTLMLFDDNLPNKSFEQLLNQPDLQDQMTMIYPTQQTLDTPSRNQDPGRIRFEPFFKKMYGNTKDAVKKNLTTISFCGQKVQVTTINEVHKKLLLISAALQKEEKWTKYLQNVGGTFNWRTIAGTDRLSMHSFGMTIDINVKYADYWRWNVADKQANSKRHIYYKNKIPLEIVRIFEKHGFIWGGKWYHYDTMHFEYRPELFNE